VTGLTNSIKFLKTYLEVIEGKIDQTMLKFDVGVKEYEKFVEKSEKYSFRALVVPSSMVGYVVSITKYPVVGVVGFPYGYYPLASKLEEIRYCARNGAREVDAVLNLINLRSKNIKEVRREVKELVKEAHNHGLKIKLIIETSILSDSEIVDVSKIIMEEGADYIKTNTGYGSRGVLIKDVVLIKEVVGDKIGIKAAGGIRSAIDAAILLYFGADVLGTSKGIEISKEARRLIKQFKNSCKQWLK